MGNSPALSAGCSEKQRGKPWAKGVSGNPSGRAKLPEDVKHVRELARLYTKQAIAALADVVQGGSPNARVAAANALIDRGWGRPEQPITGVDGQDIGIALRWQE